MTTKMAQKAGLKLFEKHMEQYAPADPYYEEWTDEKGKKQRRKVSSSLFARFQET
jgi:hypothetical protein